MKLNRTVFVPATTDPFLLTLFCRLFLDIWQDEVDSLYICYNEANIPFKIIEYVKTLCNHPKIHLIYVDHPLSYGEPINNCLNESIEDSILLLETDGFIFKKGVVDECFKLIESGQYDMLGSPRFSCTNGIANATKKKYNLNFSGIRDVGPNFWPNFLFVKRSDLLKTDRNFGGKGWKKGEYIKELDMTCLEDECGDTFVWSSIQLRAMGLKIKDILQYHASPNEMDEKQRRYGKWGSWTDTFGWIHGGSLSVGWPWLIDKSYGDPPVGNDYGIQEFETRIAFWTMAVDLNEYKELSEFKLQYKEGIRTMSEHFGMKRERIDWKIKTYKELFNIK